MAFRFDNGSATVEALGTVNLGLFGNNTSETRVMWCRVDIAPPATRNMISQASAGASNFLIGTGGLQFARDYVTVDANAVATLANMNCKIGEPWFAAAVLDANVPRLYGGTLTIPATAPSAYAVGPTTGTGGIVDKSAANIHIGGFVPNVQGFPGPIWACAWFNYALSLKDIRTLQEDLRTGQPSRFSSKAIGYWRFDKGYGRVLDDSGRGTHLAIATGGDDVHNAPYGHDLPRRTFLRRRLYRKSTQKRFFLIPA